jgi:hypothetical protein
MIVLDIKVSLRTIDDHNDALFDVFEGLETFQQIFGELWKLICPGLTDVGFVNHEHYFDLGVNIEESLHKEGVGNFIFLAFVILEAGTVIESQVVDDQLVGDRCL